MANIIDIEKNLDLGKYGDYATDYIGSNVYVGEMVNELADGQTSIYYSDILDFIRENPEALADVVDEGLYVPCAGYDLYQHAQVAEYMTIERDIYSHITDILYYMALRAWQREHGDEIPDELAEELETWANSDPDRVDEIDDIINDYMEDR